MAWHTQRRIHLTAPHFHPCLPQTQSAATVLQPTRGLPEPLLLGNVSETLRVSCPSLSGFLL